MRCSTPKRSSDGAGTTTSSARRAKRGWSRNKRIHGRTSDRIVVAALGDSITEGSPGLTGWDVWAARADPRLEFRNCGIYGQRTDEIAARLDDCTRGVDALVVQGGINDIAQGRPLELAAKNLRTMVRRGSELGLRVLLVDVLLWN